MQYQMPHLHPQRLGCPFGKNVGSDLQPQHLGTIGQRKIAFDELPDAFQAYIDGTVTGRIVVEI